MIPRVISFLTCIVSQQCTLLNIYSNRQPLTKHQIISQIQKIIVLLIILIVLTYKANPSSYLTDQSCDVSGKITHFHPLTWPVNHLIQTPMHLMAFPDGYIAHTRQYGYWSIICCQICDYEVRLYGMFDLSTSIWARIYDLCTKVIYM